MPTLKIKFRFAVMTMFILLGSCIKDVDMDQAREIVIPPTIALDLVYFTLNTSQFVQESPSQVWVAEDEVRLEFLDDDYISDGLVRADLNFRYTNTFPEPFTNKIVFLSEDNRERYSIEFEIPAGSAGSPNIVNYTEIIQEDKIDAIRKSIKMRVGIEMQPSSGMVEGELQLKSRGFFTFEFK